MGVCLSGAPKRYILSYIVITHILQIFLAKVSHYFDSSLHRLFVAALKLYIKDFYEPLKS